MSGLPIKSYSQGDSYIVFKVEELWNGWVKKDEVNASLI